MVEFYTLNLPTSSLWKMQMSSTRVVILAGGRGTRLRPFTASFPKPLVPVGDMPILALLLHQLINQQFSQVTLTLGHLSELVRAYIHNQSTISKTLNVDFVDEDRPTGTAGSLARVSGLTDTFLVMNGDVLTNLDLNALIRTHKQSRAALTIASHTKLEKIDLGVMEADENGRLHHYVEKPTHKFDVSMGVYVYEPSVLRFIEPDAYLDFPTLVSRLLERGELVRIFRSDAFWLDIGRPEDYAKAQEIFEKRPEYFGLAKPEERIKKTPLQKPSLVPKIIEPRLNV